LLVLRFLPKVLCSRILGILERIPIPRSLRGAAFGWYVRRYGADLSEARRPLADFPTFNEFFLRELREGTRPIDPDPASVVSPVDGRIVAFGAIERGRLIQAKGLDYSLEELVGSSLVSAGLVGGSQLTLYLAPGDYHRIHAPVGGGAALSVHIPGTLWPVNDAAASSIRDLFIRNERVVTGLETPDGIVVLVKIGAFNVGSIRVEYDPEVGRGRRQRYRAYPMPRIFLKGAELARFEMGSSVVLLLPRGYALAPGLKVGNRVRVGVRVGERVREQPASRAAQRQLG
jgi:phosphatidylserine decarboxylase